MSIVDPSPSYLLHSNTAALNLVLSLSYFLIWYKETLVIVAIKSHIPSPVQAEVGTRQTSIS